MIVQFLQDQLFYLGINLQKHFNTHAMDHSIINNILHLKPCFLPAFKFLTQFNLKLNFLDPTQLLLCTECIDGETKRKVWPSGVYNCFIKTGLMSL